MTEEIKEILEFLEDNNRERPFGISKYDLKVLKDYITNLQQDLNKANDIIEKDRQFYKCRMDEYAELKKENEMLKEIIKDNTILVKDENGNYQECNINPLDYKSRCEKAIEEISYMSTDTYTDNYDIRDKHCNLLLNILNGSDEK